MGLWSSKNERSHGSIYVQSQQEPSIVGDVIFLEFPANIIGLNAK